METDRNEKVFEQKIGSMRFEVAMRYLREGKILYRQEWETRRMWIAIAGWPNDESVNYNGMIVPKNNPEDVIPTSPFIFMFHRGRVFPWNPNSDDLLAADWRVLEIDSPGEK